MHHEFDKFDLKNHFTQLMHFLLKARRALHSVQSECITNGLIEQPKLQLID